MRIQTLLFLCTSVAYAQEIDFAYDIRPILSKKCFSCHGPAKAKGKLRLDTLQGIQKVTKANSVGQTEIINRITTEDKDERMPPHKTGAILSKKEKETLLKWVGQGAFYKGHWSFQVLKKVMPPKSEYFKVIDKFVFSKLKKMDLSPSPPAPKRKLIRRLSLDLRGVTPSIAEVEHFLKDKSKNAYSKLVDEFLNSPLYGEKWASKWLDLARYADTRGYEKDKHRDIWQYRDWVIEALNNDMPYNIFSIKQLAGDLLPNASKKDIIATAFHRNTMTNDEGGTDDEEFRSEAVKDRTDTTGNIWLGVSFNCAKCHSHKYDPISQKEYYSFYAYFNQTEDKDDEKDSPLMHIQTEQEEKKLIELTKLLKTLNAERNLYFNKKEVQELYAQWKKTQNNKNLRNRFFEHNSELKKMTMVINKNKKLKNKSTGSSIPIMKERSLKNQRENYIHDRGFFLNKGEKVIANTPAFLHKMKKGQKQNRLVLAKWLFEKENPLVARVTVNRIWAQIFGRGLVETEEDFGSQGSMPSHPQLLDWLAMYFIEKNWSQKELIKKIVFSETYKQSSVVSNIALEKDPSNVYLSRGARFRMTIEMIRDSSLKVAGLLSSKMYGPPVMPYQPPGLWQTAYNHVTWKVSDGEDKYRRSLYTYSKRTAPYPTKINFDASSREVCTVRRIRSNTPLQALNTLNDPVYIEAAQAFARVLISKSNSVEEGIELAFERALSRKALLSEIKTLKYLYRNQLDYYKKHLPEASLLAEIPLGKIEPKINLASAAAWTAVCNVVLNLDEFLTKE